MAIVRGTSSAADAGFASSISLTINPSSSAAGRVVLGQFDNDSLTEHLTSSTYNLVSATLGTEEVFSSVTNANVAYLIGDSNVPTGTKAFKGNFTDGSHHPGGVVVGYSGVSAISIVAQGHGDTGGTPAVPISLTASGFNVGDQAVAFFAFFGGASITYTDTNGVQFLSTGATTFRYIGTELTASGSSVTINGTPSARAEWIGFMFRLQPLASGIALNSLFVRQAVNRGSTY